MRYAQSSEQSDWLNLFGSGYKFKLAREHGIHGCVIGMEVNGLKCTCVVEYVSEVGQVLRKQVFKTAILDLGRNELNDIVLKLTYKEGERGPFTIRDHIVHKKFVKDGKATIRLLTQRIQILISNCPPEQLGLFLRSMAIKVAARGKLQGAKRRMIGDVSLQFDEISPLNEKDLENARRNTGRPNKSLTTPKRADSSISKPPKRKLSEMNTSRDDTQGNPMNPAKKPVLLKSSGLPLSIEQARVLELVKNGDSVFFTGSAGTGKSYLLKRIISAMPPETTFPTASTGAAACHIGGTTLHAFAGIGIGSGTLEHCIGLASREHRAAQWKKCRCLIIDEISMIDAEYFDKLEAVARAVRNSRNPFGGIQLVLCGDFLQLPPVAKDGEKKQHCFQSHSWFRCITRSIELTDIYRQSDKQFVAVLQNIRIGRCPPAVTQLLRNTEQQVIEHQGIQATKLYTHKEDVEATNLRELAALWGTSKKYEAQDSDPHMSRTLDNLCPAASSIELKVGAQVMLTKNMDVSRGLVNGARGVVKQFETGGKGYPLVVFTSGLEVTMTPEKWSVRVGSGNVVTRRQLPLKLAWAISIHKSQGMTLDCVEVSLGRAFEDGQAYVALSRARSLQSLRVKDFNPACVHAHPDVLDYYRGLRRMRRNYIEDRAESWKN